MSGLLGQLDVAATSLSDVYTVPLATIASVRIVVVNDTGGAIDYQLSLAPEGDPDSDEHRLTPTKSLAANSEAITSAPLVLGATDVVRIYTSAIGIRCTVTGVTESE